MNKDELSQAAKLFARQGGLATLKKHGKKHYREMAKLRWEKYYKLNKQKNGKRQNPTRTRPN